MGAEDDSFEEPLRVLVEGIWSSIDTPGRWVFERAEDFVAFWDEHTERTSPKPDIPAVDFGRERVFVAVAGPDGDGSLAVRVARASTDPSERTTTVVVNLIEDAREDRVGISAMTMPHAMVAAPKRSTGIVWHDDLLRQT